MRALATGDLHLGAGQDLGRSPGDRLLDQAVVLDQISDLAIDRAVGIILIAGDVFEGPSIPPEHLDVFATFIARCHAAQIPVLACLGNGRHDAAMRTKNGLDIFRHILGITIASTPRLVEIAGTVIALMPWASVSNIVAAHDGEIDRDDVNGFAAELLLNVARGLRAQCAEEHPGKPAILMTHFSISGAALPTGLSTDLLREPVLPLLDLELLGFDAIVASHIHVPQLLATAPAEPEMPILYTGSPMPLSFGEAGYQHGVWVLDVDAGTVPEFVPIESRPFVNIEIADVIGMEHILLGDPFVKVRGEISEEARRRLDWPAIVNRLEEAGAYRVWDGITVARDDVVRGDSEVHENLEPLDQLAAYLLHTGVNGDVGALIVERTARNLEALS